MTLTIDAASTPVDDDGSRPVAPGHQVEASRRGRTTVARGVVESIVGRVAVETPGVAGAQLTGIRGWFASRRPDAAHAAIGGSHDGLHVVLDLAIEYPQPVADVVRDVRRRVVAHLDERLDLQVGTLDVRVIELRRARTPVTVERRLR